MTKKLDYHFKPENLSDRIAFSFTKLLRFTADFFFAKRYGHRAVVLETVAAVPGMVAGMLNHLKSLRRMEQDPGWIKILLDEAENERMHLMTFIHIAKPSSIERFIIILVQGIFFNLYFIMYLISPRTCHRIVGYFEEEAVTSYSEYLEEVEQGRLENVPAPKIAIDYWNLPAYARLADVIRVVREDEAGHRDVNHKFVKLIDEKKPENINIEEDDVKTVSKEIRNSSH
jgi:ubiquinol oxidase